MFEIVDKSFLVKSVFTWIFMFISTLFCPWVYLLASKSVGLYPIRGKVDKKLTEGAQIYKVESIIFSTIYQIWD